MKMLTKLLLSLFLLAGTHAAFAQSTAMPDKAQEAEIRRMLELTGMNKMVGQMIDQMLSGFQASSPGMDAGLWDELRSEMKAEELIERLLPVYAKYYSTEDLRAINEFYSTPAGQRLLKQMPFAMKDSMVIGQQWGQEAGERAVKKIEAARKAQAAAPAAKASN